MNKIGPRPAADVDRMIASTVVDYFVDLPDWLEEINTLVTRVVFVGGDDPLICIRAGVPDELELTVTGFEALRHVLTTGDLAGWSGPTAEEDWILVTVSALVMIPDDASGLDVEDDGT